MEWQSLHFTIAQAEGAVVPWQQAVLMAITSTLLGGVLTQLAIDYRRHRLSHRGEAELARRLRSDFEPYFYFLLYYMTQTNFMGRQMKIKVSGWEAPPWRRSNTEAPLANLFVEDQGGRRVFYILQGHGLIHPVPGGCEIDERLARSIESYTKCRSYLERHADNKALSVKKAEPTGWQELWCGLITPQSNTSMGPHHDGE